MSQRFMQLELMDLRMDFSNYNKSAVLIPQIFVISFLRTVLNTHKHAS